MQIFMWVHPDQEAEPVCEFFEGSSIHTCFFTTDPSVEAPSTFAGRWEPVEVYVKRRVL